MNILNTVVKHHPSAMLIWRVWHEYGGGPCNFMVPNLSSAVCARPSSRPQSSCSPHSLPATCPQCLQRALPSTSERKTEATLQKTPKVYFPLTN